MWPDGFSTCDDSGGDCRLKEERPALMVTSGARVRDVPFRRRSARGLLRCDSLYLTGRADGFQGGSAMSLRDTGWRFALA